MNQITEMHSSHFSDHPIFLKMSLTVEETIKNLVEMGFSEERSKKALNKTGWAGIEQLVYLVLLYS